MCICMLVTPKSTKAGFFLNLSHFKQKFLLIALLRHTQLFSHYNRTYPPVPITITYYHYYLYSQLDGIILHQLYTPLFSFLSPATISLFNQHLFYNYPLMFAALCVTHDHEVSGILSLWLLCFVQSYILRPLNYVILCINCTLLITTGQINVSKYTIAIY